MVWNIPSSRLSRNVLAMSSAFTSGIIYSSNRDYPGREQPLSQDSLFHADLREELAQLPRPHPSFLVSLLTREEPAIVAFRDQIADWWSHLGDGARTPYASRLRSLEDDEFFQAFGNSRSMRSCATTASAFISTRQIRGWMGASSGADGGGVDFGLQCGQ